MIDTERLILRPYMPEDLDLLASILGDAVTMAFWPQPFTREQTLAWMERSLASYAEHGFGRWLVIERERGTAIGTSGLMRATVNGREVNDIGYIIHHPWWRKGYATEAARGVMEYAFGPLGLEMVHANMAFDHHGSQRVAELLGMRRIAEFSNERNRGIRTFVYEIGRGEWGEER